KNWTLIVPIQQPSDAQVGCPLSGAKPTCTVVWLRPPWSRMTQSGHWPTRNAAVQRRRLSPADIALCHSITSSACNRREVGIVSLIYKRLLWGFASGDLVLRFGREIAGVMSFVQLFFKRPAGSVDHPPAFDGQALADFFRPPRQVFIFVGLQE